MTAKKRKIEAFSQPRGGFKKMFSAEDKALIRTLYAEKHVSIRCIAQMVHVSRNAVRRQIREEGKARAAGSAQRRGGISEGTCHRCSGAVSGVRNAVPAATSSAQQRLSAVFVKILQKNWLGVFLSLKNLSRGFAPTLRYPRIFF